MDTCSVDGCEEEPRGKKGLCKKHYRRQYYEQHREHEIKTAIERAQKRKEQHDQDAGLGEAETEPKQG